MRERLDGAKSMLTGLHERVQDYAGPLELPEPDEELKEVIERIVERETRHVPVR